MLEKTFPPHKSGKKRAKVVQCRYLVSKKEDNPQIPKEEGKKGEWHVSRWEKRAQLKI